MKIILTGPTGFIGSRLLASIKQKYGVENILAVSSRPVPGVETLTYYGDAFNVDEIHKSHLADVDVLMHVGAFTPKSGAEVNAIHGSTANIRFTEKLLELPLRNLKSIVYTSTLDVYEPSELITESTPTIPTTLYGASKLYCEKLISVYAAERRIKLQLLRVGHVYGPGEEKYNKLIPRIIKSILLEDFVELWGDGTELRSFIYIDDVVSALMKAAVLSDDVGPINVVGGTPVSIRDIVKKILDLSGGRARIVEKMFDGPKRNYVFDNSKMMTYLLDNETQLESGLRKEIIHMGGVI